MKRLTIDTALIWQARLGQEKAWDELMNTFKPVFTRMAKTIARDSYEHHERQDLIAEGYLALVEYVRDWDGTKDFSGSLIREAKGRMSKMYYLLFQKGPVVPRTTMQRIRKVEALIAAGASMRDALEKYNSSVAKSERVTLETFIAAYNTRNTKEVTEYE